MTKRGWLGVLIVLVVIAAAVGGYSWWQAERFVQYDVLFGTSGGLQAGSAVTFGGVPIGKVKELIPDPQTGKVIVRIGIEPERAVLITDRAVVRIGDAQMMEALLPTSVVVNMSAPDGVPLPPGSVITGADSEIAAQWEAAQQQGKSFIDQNLRVGQLEVQTAIDRDGHAQRTFAIELGAVVPTELLVGPLLPKGGGWQSEAVDLPAGGKRVVVAGNFNRVQDASWRGSKPELMRTGKLFTEEFSYREVIEPNTFAVNMESVDSQAPAKSIGEWIRSIFAGEASLREAAEEVYGGVMREIEQAKAIPANRIGVRVTLEMPGKINETNAAFYDGNVASWTLTGEDVQGGIVFYARSWRVLWVRVMVTGGLLLAAGALVAYLLRPQRRVPRRIAADYD